MSAPDLKIVDSPSARRARQRQEMVEAILAAARAIMLKEGTAALKLNEVARRVQLRPQSLAGYFRTKTELIDALILQALELFLDGDEQAYREHPPGWDQISAWFGNRIRLAVENPDLHELLLGGAVPDYQPTDDARALSRSIRTRSSQMVAEAIAEQALDPRMPIVEATDLLMAIRRGLIAERLGKHSFEPAGSTRFDMLLPNALSMLRLAWSPSDATSSDNRRSTYPVDAYA